MTIRITQRRTQSAFYPSRAAMLEPQRSPIAILERIAGYPLSI